VATLGTAGCAAHRPEADDGEGPPVLVVLRAVGGSSPSIIYRSPASVRISARKCPVFARIRKSDSPEPASFLGVLSVADLLTTYEEAESLEEAERALDELATLPRPSDLSLGELYDGLAEGAAEDGDFPLAVRAQRRAIELGCDHVELGREMLAWYLLKAGRKQEGEAAFAELRDEHGEDLELLLTVANARMDSGDGQGALEAFDDALSLATRSGDRDWVRQVREERRYVRGELGLEPDEEDRLADLAEPTDAEGRVRLSLAWFPRDQIEAALARWPSLADDLDDADDYCRSIEGTLQTMLAGTGRRPTVAPLDIERLLVFAAEHGLDADSGAARSRFAAELDSRGEALAWPPGRNDPCWCGSARKYKRCCGRGRPGSLA
jgi:tetratricopeptide (TPR) repeat protein